MLFVKYEMSGKVAHPRNGGQAVSPAVGGDVSLAKDGRITSNSRR